jgi:hypothetical protein
MRAFLLLLPALALLLSGCGEISPVMARQTAITGGCWPDGIYQPVTPTINATAALSETMVQPTNVLVYPPCTPLPGTPSRTASPTRTATLIPQPTAQALVNVLQGAAEIGDQPGYASARTMALSPDGSVIAVGYISWGANRLDDSSDGRVWTRVRSPKGIWTPLQTLNISPVKKFFGGVALAIDAQGTVYGVFGAGGINGDSGLYLVESHDYGLSWSQPQPVGVDGAAPPVAEQAATATPLPTVTTGPSQPSPTARPPSTDYTAEGMDGGALALRVDAHGGLHLLYLSSAGGYHVGYSYRAPSGSWQRYERFQGGEQYGAQMDVVSLPDGTVQRFVLVKDGGNGAHITLYRSEDGQNWQGKQMETRRFLNSETVIATSVVTVPRGESALVAVAWSQYAAGGVFAQISLDGGESWSREEQIAQHQSGGNLFDGDGKGLLAGFEPSLAYDAVSDRLVASWVELDLGPRPILGRTLLSMRPLTPNTSASDAPWLYAITPESDDSPPQLSSMGLRGALFGSADGRAHWLLTLDERNEEFRVEARPVNITGLLQEDPS